MHVETTLLFPALRIAALALAACLSAGTGVAAAAQGDCIQPVSTGPVPTVGDCLYILRAAVHLESCSPTCICAPKGTLPATAADALVCLKKVVGQQVALDCPCAGGSTTTTTMPPSIDTLVFSHACARIHLSQPLAGLAEVIQTGTVEMEIDLASLADRDGDGVEEVFAELTDAFFEDTSTPFGTITVELADPSIHPALDHRSVGEIEENVNATPGVLDLPPYAASGSAEASFDLYLQASLGTGRAHNDVPITVEGTFRASPPLPGDLLTMVNADDVPLLKDDDTSFFQSVIDSANAATLDLEATDCQ
jgi:hypothetical protein